jgi:hypothetical protein
MTIVTQIIGNRVRRVAQVDRLANIVAPYHPVLAGSNAAAGAAGTIYGLRVVVQQTGVLHDLAAFHLVSSGNHRIGVYDTGDALAGSRSLLYDSGSVALNGTANSWQIAGDPALAVTAGKHLDLVLMADNTTVTFSKAALATSAQALLPAAFLPAPGGALSKVAWAYAIGAYAAFPATILEANCSASAGVQDFFVMGRVA